MPKNFYYNDHEYYIYNDHFYMDDGIPIDQSDYAYAYNQYLYHTKNELTEFSIKYYIVANRNGYDYYYYYDRVEKKYRWCDAKIKPRTIKYYTDQKKLNQALKRFIKKYSCEGYDFRVITVRS